MTFHELLTSKRIDAAALQQGDPALHAEWDALFAQVSPASFVQQELFRINPVRRQYPLKEAPAEKPKAAAAKPKVVVRPKPKTD